MLYTIIIIITLFIIATAFTMSQAKFGRAPQGARLARILKSPNYRNGAFQNQSYTPILAEDASYWALSWNFFFGRREKLSPIDSMPSMKTNLINLNLNEDLLVWFGHSSYFMQLSGKRFLVDPVLSGSASPFSFMIKAFKGANNYSAKDFPDIDYLIITHDHWDHLDYETVLQLKQKVKTVICGLGVGEHFESWGFDATTIVEMDWNDKLDIDSGFVINATPARHFSGRTFKRNQTLWCSYVVQTPTKNIFLGGDGGYDNHFAAIGQQFGSIDLAILENGQYNNDWRYIHTLPNEIGKVFRDLKAKKLLAVHSSKFALAKHAWDEPLISISATSKAENIHLITPMIGELVHLNDDNQQFAEWWKGVN